MKIGLDIASTALKGQVDTIILTTGDRNLVPAAKVARWEGGTVGRWEGFLDPMWWNVAGGLMKHMDGISFGFDRPERKLVRKRNKAGYVHLY